LRAAALRSEITVIGLGDCPEPAAVTTARCFSPAGRGKRNRARLQSPLRAVITTGHPLRWMPRRSPADRLPEREAKLRAIASPVSSECISFD
jgi:hypothetical protein